MKINLQCENEGRMSKDELMKQAGTLNYGIFQSKQEEN